MIVCRVLWWVATSILFPHWHCFKKYWYDIHISISLRLRATTHAPSIPWETPRIGGCENLRLKPLYLKVETLLSCGFFLKPIHWFYWCWLCCGGHYYIYTEASGSNKNKVFSLETPRFVVNPTMTTLVNFWYHMKAGPQDLSGPGPPGPPKGTWTWPRKNKGNTE